MARLFAHLELTCLPIQECGTFKNKEALTLILDLNCLNPKNSAKKASLSTCS